MFSTSVQNTFSPKILFCKFTQKENIIVEDLLVHVNVCQARNKIPFIQWVLSKLFVLGLEQNKAVVKYPFSSLRYVPVLIFRNQNYCDFYGSIFHCPTSVRMLVEMYSLQEMVKWATQCCQDCYPLRTLRWKNMNRCVCASPPEIQLIS